MLNRTVIRLCLKNFSRTTNNVSVRAKPQNINPNNDYKKLIKPLLFTTTICGSSFVVANIVQFENDQYFRRHLKSFAAQPFWNYPQQQANWLDKLKKEWDSQGSSFKIFAGIAAVNILVFLCWHVPKLNPIMTRYFVSKVEKDSIRCLPMILSTFSHYSVTHLAMNLVVLYSFSQLSMKHFGKENFLALYLSSGVVSSFVSCFHKVLSNSFTPSLGASGAILGILGATCFENPDIRLVIIFLPFFSFSALTALKGILLLDTLGIIFRWQLFDHAAHLGGTLFGIYYSNYLRQYFNENKFSIIQNWKIFKNKIKTFF